MTYLRSKSSPSQFLTSKSLASSSFPSAALFPTGSDLLDTLCCPSPAADHETLFEQVPTHGLGLHNIEIPQLASQSARLAVQKSLRKKLENNDESASGTTQSSPRDRALERIHRTVKMDRSKMDLVRPDTSRINRSAS